MLHLKVIAMNMKSQAFYEETVLRAGMQVCGGNLSLLPHTDPVSNEAAGTVAWAGRGMGLFVVDAPSTEIVELEAVALRDVIACTVVLGDNGAATDFAIGGRRFDAEGSDMTMVFVPRGERFRFATQTRHGLKAVTVMVHLISIMKTYGFKASALPKSLLKIIDAGEIVMDKLIPGHFGTIATDVIGRRGLFPSLAPLYYEGKMLELMSTLLNQLSRRDAIRSGDGAFLPEIFQRLEEVKKIVDLSPHRALDIDALARVAAMNRTKLRAAFKQAYGTTLSDYRVALLLQKADSALKEKGVSVEQAAYRAGYAGASSFIVAYKRQYGLCPGDVLRQRCISRSPTGPVKLRLSQSILRPSIS
jgi:AraC-like DNA-binding protein